jgi:hypothetical protein
VTRQQLNGFEARIYQRATPAGDATATASTAGATGE